MNGSRKRARGGFTLIELLLVLVIVATLAALVAPQFVGRSQDAKIKAAQGQISHFETALKMFESDYGKYPTTEEGLDALAHPPALPDGKENEKVYLDKDVPLDPWGNPFEYESPGEKNPKFVDIWSSGPDGEPGNEDDIGNWSSSSE